LGRNPDWTNYLRKYLHSAQEDRHGDEFGLCSDAMPHAGHDSEDRFCSGS